MSTYQAPTIYQDVYVRDNFGDRGELRTTGMACKSPDIIPYQDGQLTWPQILNTYDNSAADLGKTLIYPGRNNIYVRAKNLQPTGTETGVVNLYYARWSLILDPDQWRNNRIHTPDNLFDAKLVNQAGSTMLAPNEIAITSPAFALGSLPDANDYCFIAVVNTPHNAVTIPMDFNSTAHFVDWVQTNPSVAWRNITIVKSAQPRLYKTYVFGSDDPDEETFHFMIKGQNMPVNTQVSVQCTDVLCPINWTGYLPPPDSEGNQVTGFDQRIPGKFKSGLTLVAAPPSGQSFRPGSRLDLAYYQLNRRRSALHLRVGRDTQVARALPSGEIRSETLFLTHVGDCTIVVQ